MRTLFVLSLLMIGASVANRPARGDEPPETSLAPAADGAGAAQETPSHEAPASDGEQWRFRKHQGLWWYWLPSEKWVYWNDGRWVDYEPTSYAEFRRSRSARRYSYTGDRDGYPQLGKWGPVRYDSYGQRQYPYSMRKSGIRQLGPVPAMGGVRSLPGWGGER